MRNVISVDKNFYNFPSWKIHNTVGVYAASDKLNMTRREMKNVQTIVW